MDEKKPVRPKKRRVYTDAEKAAVLVALDSNGGKVRKTAEIERVPIATVADWKDGAGISAAVQAKRTEQIPDLAARFEGIAERIVGHVAQMPLDKARLNELMVAAGIAVDKARLLRGQATDISARLSVKVDLRAAAEQIASRHGRDVAEVERELLKRAGVKAG